MSNRHHKQSKQLLNKDITKFEVHSNKIDHNFVLEIVVGASNVERWNRFKVALSCTTNEELATFLLDLAHKHNIGYQEKPATQDSDDIKTFNVPELGVTENKKNVERRKCNRKHRKAKTIKSTAPVNVELQRETEETDLKDTKIFIYKSNDAINMEESNSENLVPHGSSHNSSEHISLSSPILKNKECKQLESSKIRKHRRKVKRAGGIDKKRKFICKQKKLTSNYDIRKAPELNKQVEPKSLLSTDNHEKLHERVAIKIKLCSVCNTRHLQDRCPLQHPHCFVSDDLTYADWLNKYKSEMSELDESDDNLTFAFLSLPNSLCLNNSSDGEGLSVFSNADIKKFTQFGPLIGKIIKEVDIPEDFNMKYLWQVYTDKIHIYVNTEDVEDSNWIRFVRPAPTRDECNIASFCKDAQLFLVTTKDVLIGHELLYWHEDAASLNNKKKMEKTTCGGCNITFAHPLYYQTHCSIFHDVRYSLTIRKYHCKVCGAAVLGKENIMKHAAELHNGQGAYQCQFCKKFFLRLNYLEMHRTYGCSANPHRSRPLCDFCGRKFCQPQKLKVHIKRMHSDLSEVLKEFQCKNCLKLLGSRAALQRHMKEVHNKQINGSCACSRCGKLFQNKSNLKIHMLTHSGIKPFKCAEGTCNAAFTTKQCLQFHYKKVHGFSDDAMPKIERSVDYTFEAYSGDQEQDMDNLDEKQIEDNNDTDFMSLNDGSDGDNSLEEERNLDDPPALHSPAPIITDHSSNSNQSPPTLEPYPNTNLKILSKGSKKWLGEQPLPSMKNDIYHVQVEHSIMHKMEHSSGIILDVEESQNYERSKLNLNLNAYSRHESSNASLLVEAALDSVSDIHCNESNIVIDVDSNTNATDALVNNLCNLSHSDALSDVPYSHSVDLAESRDINLISPSVNEPISVTDGENMGIDYSNFHHNDFNSPPSSPPLDHKSNFNRDYIDVGQVSPPHNEQPNYNDTQSKNISPDSSPPRYNFGHGINCDNVSSDESNGIGVQNLSLHNSKTQSHLDLSLYKSPYGLEAAGFQLRKDFGLKLNLETERKQVYVLEINDSKGYHDTNLNEENNLQSESSDRDHVDNFHTNICNKDFETMSTEDGKYKNSEHGTPIRSKYHDVEPFSNDLRNKQFEIDINLRPKNYDIINESLRRSSYDGVSETDFRVKTYDTFDAIETRNNLSDSEFRLDRNFEPLVLNTSELQGLDMSARGYHGYHPTSTVQNLNRYHHIYPEVDRPSVDLRLSYSPPLPTYTHSDVLRVVSLDLTSPGRHSVDLSLRPNPLHVHQLGNSRLLSDHTIQTNRLLTDNRMSLDQNGLLNRDVATNRHNPRLLTVSDGSRILSDHSTNRLLATEQLSVNHLISSEQSRIITDESRLIGEQPRLLEQGRLHTETPRILPTASGSGSASPLAYGSYSVSPTQYHPTALTTRSPTLSPYHHYSNYY